MNIPSPTLTSIPVTSGSAIASLILGILAWTFLPFIGAILAVILGHLARSEIRRAPPGTFTGDGLAVAGLVLGYVQLGFSALFLGFFLLGGLAIMAGFMGMFTHAF